MTLNPETAIPETIDLRQRRGRIPTSDFRCRPTNNPMSLDNHADVHEPPDSRPELLVEKLYIYRIVAERRIDMTVLDEVRDNLLRTDAKIERNLMQKAGAKQLPSDSLIFDLNLLSVSFIKVILESSRGVLRKGILAPEESLMKLKTTCGGGIKKRYTSTRGGI
ncbi:hypothetical protein CUMW_243290 [Citrus unshiu]|nr:hypothetical protein CUMW_243290 [Citrus unshiu]